METTQDIRNALLRSGFTFVPVAKRDPNVFWPNHGGADVYAGHGMVAIFFEDRLVPLVNLYRARKRYPYRENSQKEAGQFTPIGSKTDEFLFLSAIERRVNHWTLVSWGERNGYRLAGHYFSSKIQGDVRFFICHPEISHNGQLVIEVLQDNTWVETHRNNLRNVTLNDADQLQCSDPYDSWAGIL